MDFDGMSTFFKVATAAFGLLALIFVGAVVYGPEILWRFFRWLGKTE